MAPASPSAKVKSVVAMGLRMNGAEKFMNSLEGADWTGRCFYTVTVLFTFPKMLRKERRTFSEWRAVETHVHP